MRQNILFLFSFLLIGCGAQNSPKENAPTPGEVAFADNGMVLPQCISIPFPRTITPTPNSLFNEDVEHVKKIKNLLLKNLSLLEAKMPEITQKCQALTICHLDEYPTLGSIEYRADTSRQNYPYSLSLEISPTELVTYKWSEHQDDVLSTYSSNQSRLSLHYLYAQNREFMTIEDTHVDAFNSFVVSKQESRYHLSSNHIKAKRENFSSNILFDAERMLEYNEQLYPFDSIAHDLKDGTYALLPKTSQIASSALMDVTDHALGTFSMWHGEVQGFLYSDEFIDTIEDLKPYYLTR